MPPRRGTRGASPAPTQGRGWGRGRGRGRGGSSDWPQAQAHANARPQRIGTGTTTQQMQQQNQRQQQQRQHRVYEPGRRHMELIASVSRSSGLEKDGDALRDPKIQEEYRAFIQGKIDEYWKKYPLRSHRARAPGHEDADAAVEAEATAGAEADVDADADARRNRKEMEENLLILFRKLREGLLSTQRRDAFALEVYETSLHLSVLFESPVQTTSTLSHLFPDLYVNFHTQLTPTTSSPSVPSNAAPTGSSQTPDPRPATHSRGDSLAGGTEGEPAAEPKPKPNPTSTVPRSALSSTLILLLHHLAQSYPSQIAFHRQLRQLHPALQDVLRARPGVLPEPEPPALASLTAPVSPMPFASGAEPQRSLSAAAPSPRTSASASPAGLGPHADNDYESETAAAAASTSAREWALDLARCLRARNYARLGALTRREAYAAFVLEEQQQQEPLPSQSNHLRARAMGNDAAATSCVPEPQPWSQPKADTDTHTDADADDERIAGAVARVRRSQTAGLDRHTGTNSDWDGRALALEALGKLVEALLDKARGTTWAVLRSAYREVSLRAVVPRHVSGASTTGEWLARSLVLRAGPRAVGDRDDAERMVRVAERWLDGRRVRGEARRKEGEGTEGRWVLVKA